MKESNASVILKKDNKQYNGIDLMKFISALLVVMIHVAVLNPSMDQELSHKAQWINFGLNNTLCRIAVPFYFVCSGFFLFRKMPGNTVDVDRVKAYCYRICRLLGLWSVVLFVGEQEHLWYLGATVVAVTLLSVLLYKGVRVKWLIALAGCLYLLGLLGESYFRIIKPYVTTGKVGYVYGIYRYLVTNPRNGFYMGFIFVLMGYLFARGNIKMNRWISLVAFLTSMICLVGEVFLLNYGRERTACNMYISLLPAVFFLFAFLSSVSLKDRTIYGRLRIVGMLVYFIHMLVNALFILGAKLCYGIIHVDIYSLRFPLVMAVTLGLAFGLERLSNKEAFKWIRGVLS